MPYTHLNNNGYKTEALAWNGMYISQSTQRHRNQLRHAIDDFTNFYWCGVDAFETFGAFIINNKNSLKIYNGPSYSNEYSKPQFESATGQLTGITFQVQKIDFTIGVYWINERDYRKLINWLNPYEINTLSFDFEPNYYYQVKLASVSDGTRTVVGKEFKINYKGTFSTTTEFENIEKPAKSLIQGDSNYKYQHVYDIVDGSPKDLGRAIDEEYEYYTEIKLTFEIQGPACAYNKLPYTFDNEVSTNKKTLIMRYSDSNDIDYSDLETPIKIIYCLNLSNIANLLDVNKEYLLSINCEARYDNEGRDRIELFSVNFKNLSYLRDSQYSITGQIMLEYDSESGLLFLLNGDSDYFLLNTLTTASQGKKILDSLTINKYIIAGRFNYYIMDWKKLSFVTSASIISTDGEVIDFSSNPIFDTNKTQLIVRGRTNLI